MLNTNVLVCSFLVYDFIRCQKWRNKKGFNHVIIQQRKNSLGLPYNKNKGLTRLYRSITAIDPLSWSPFWSHQWHKREIHHADYVKRELRVNPSCLLASQRWELTVGQSWRQICTKSYRKISWCLEPPIFGSIHSTFQSLWYLTSAAALPKCLSNFRAIRSL